MNIRPEKKSKFSSVVLKLRGIDQVSSSRLLFSFLSMVKSFMTTWLDLK